MALFAELMNTGPVTVLRSDGPPGQYAAGLTFGVGRFDETLASSGITRLIGHLALCQLDGVQYSFGARVRGRFAEFTMASADPAEIAGFITAVCRGLSADHRDRLEAEKRILLGRAAPDLGAGTSVGACLSARFGAAGPGLLNHPEYGLHRLDWEEVVQWRRRWFTTGNVVIWVLGPFPSEIQLDLPDGQSRTSPDAPWPRDIPLPGYVVSGTLDMGIAMTGTCSPVLPATVRILAERLRDNLKYKSEVSYRVLDDLDWLGGDLSLVRIETDQLDDAHVVSAVDRVLETFDSLVRQGPTPEEVDEARRQHHGTQVLPETSALTLERLARRVLQSVSEDRALDLALETQATTDFDHQAIQDNAGALFSQAVFAVPNEVSLAGRMPRLPQTSPKADQIQGTRFKGPRSPQADRLDLTIGSEGIMLTSSGKAAGQTVVRYADVAALVKWNDGRMLLIGADGSSVKVNPAHWPGADVIGVLIDRGVPEALTVSVDSPAPPDWVPPEQLLTMAAVHRRWTSVVLAVLAWQCIVYGVRGLFSPYYVAGSIAIVAGAGYFFARRYIQRSSRWARQ
jgi:zinc protease